MCSLVCIRAYTETNTYTYTCTYMNVCACGGGMGVCVICGLRILGLFMHICTVFKRKDQTRTEIELFRNLLRKKLWIPGINIMSKNNQSATVSNLIFSLRS